MSQLFRLKNGTVLLSTEAPGGIYNSGQLKKIAELCSKELAIVKATEDQRLALFVKESEVEHVAKQLRAIGLGFRHYQDSLHQPVSCLGELCEEHEQPAMATAMDITKEIASIELNTPLKIGINGCSRCCTPCHTLDIAVVGDSSGYRISLGGKTKQMPEFASYFAEGVPPKELPKRLKAVIEAYKNLAEESESLHDVIERCGVADFVRALAPYSQDAAPREDLFAEQAAGESMDDLAVTTDELDAESAAAVKDDEILSFDGDDPAEDLESDLSVDDDLSIVDDQLGDGALDEIPIEKGNPCSLEDDLSLGDDEATLAINTVDFSEEDVAIKSEADDSSLELNDLDLVDEDSAVQAEDESLSLNDLDLVDEDSAVQAEDESLALSDLELVDEDSAVQAEDESLALNDLDLLEEDSAAKPDTDDGLIEDMSLDSEAITELDNEGDQNTAAAIAEDDMDLDAPGDGMDPLPESTAMELDESMTLGDELSEDPSMNLTEDLDDKSLGLEETSLDEDLDGIPELDDDLAPQEISAPSPLYAKSPAPALDHEDFDDDMQGDAPDLSDEEENQFEQKLQASIDEESRLIAKADKDLNKGDRAAALSLLENSQVLDQDLDAIELGDASLDEPLSADEELEEISSDGLDTLDANELVHEDSIAASADELDISEETENLDEVLEPIHETMEEFPEPGSSELAHIKSRQLGQKRQGSVARQQFKVSAITFQDEHMRVTFDSSAYVDFELSALGLGEERSFRLGAQNVTVTSTSEGYTLEVDGMRFFHPKSSLPVAS